MNQNKQNQKNPYESMQEEYNKKPFHVNLKALGIEQKEECNHNFLNLIRLKDGFYKIVCVNCQKVLCFGHKK